MLRQRDVIGEWVPIREPGVSDVTFRDLKWIHGLRWEEFDANYTLTHVTSKRSKEIVIPLGSAPMFKEELARLATVPASGPVIICDTTGRPWSDESFRKAWRQIANECGIPKNVRNQDSRAGAITEATEAGADLESIKHAATHSDIAMTQRYARQAAKKTAAVLELRVKHRSNREPG
jgi:site-specific recombinase XerD